MIDIIGILKRILCGDCGQKLSQCQVSLSQEVQKCLDTTKQLADLQAKYNTDSAYYQARINTLLGLVNSQYVVANLSEFGGKGVIVNPQFLFTGLTYEQADNAYYAFSLNDWKTILSDIHSSFTATWTNENFDCDDWAVLTSGLLAYADYKAGVFKDQSGVYHNFALAIAWSSDHAYNLIIDSSNGIWVAEPQTGQIVGSFSDAQAGKLNSGGLDYKSKEVWFMD